MRTRSISATLAALLLLPGVRLAAEPDRTISVTGEGTATAPPDMATIHTGVVTRASTAKEALAANNKAMEGILSALKGHNVAPKDVRTSQFNVRPVHNRDQDGRTLPEMVAYEVTNQVRVRVRQLPHLGAVLDSLVQAGSNQVSGISFGLADPGSVLDRARREAVADARRKAQLYTREADIRLGKVWTITEQPTRLPQRQYLARDAAKAASAPVATGEQEYAVSVRVVFTLEDPK